MEKLVVIILTQVAPAPPISMKSLAVKSIDVFMMTVMSQKLDKSLIKRMEITI
jgi:hypothetical protein